MREASLSGCRAVRRRRSFQRWIGRALLVGGLALPAFLQPGGAADNGGEDLDRLRARYRPPAAVSFPEDNPYTEAKAELGRRLFFDPRLSHSGTLACAGCHNPGLGWGDGRPVARGEKDQPGPRRTPTLWNLAWGEFFFWDGRAASLEEQALLPIQAELEMNHRLEDLVIRLTAIPDYQTAFAAAFPDSPAITAATVARALATYERTLISRQTPFDRWLAGDDQAIDEAAKRGFVLFNGKAHCDACHSGWNFTDQAFHDIGLPAGQDRGRGAVLKLAEADYAFKTPTLRDVARRAPYMHDGSLPTLEAVIDHYSGGFIRRPGLSADLPDMTLSGAEKKDLLAFLHTLTVPADAPLLVPVGNPITAAVTPAVPTQQVRQRDKAFDTDHVVVKAGTRLLVSNNDTRIHNLRIHHPQLDFNSGAQRPGQTVEVLFAESGKYYVFCGIHPQMKLVVDVVK